MSGTAPVQIHSHTQSAALTCTRTLCAYARTVRNAHTYITHTHKHTHTHRRTHTGRHSHKDAHTQTPTHTHTHTHTHLVLEGPASCVGLSTYGSAGFPPPGAALPPWGASPAPPPPPPPPPGTAGAVAFPAAGGRMIFSGGTCKQNHQFQTRGHAGSTREILRACSISYSRAAREHERVTTPCVLTQTYGLHTRNPAAAQTLLARNAYTGAHPV